MPKLHQRRGEFVSRSFVCPAGILSDCEKDIVKRVRRASGWKANRSRLLQALLNLAAASTNALEATDVVDQGTFEEALRNAICKSAVSIRRRQRR